LADYLFDEDEYLRYRISEQFNEIMKSMFGMHKTDALPPEQTEVIKDMKETAQAYLSVKNDRAKAVACAKMIGLDFKSLSAKEIVLLTKALSRSERAQRNG
jgi:hypothetical protein